MMCHFRNLRKDPLLPSVYVLDKPLQKLKKTSFLLGIDTFFLFMRLLKNMRKTFLKLVERSYIAIEFKGLKRQSFVHLGC